MKDSDLGGKLSWEKFLEIPVDDRYASLQRVRKLPQALYEWRKRRNAAVMKLRTAKKERDAERFRVKQSMTGQLNPATGKPYSIDAANDVAVQETAVYQDAVDVAEDKLMEVDAYLQSLQDMSGLVKGEQGRWNRESDNDVTHTGDES